MSEADTQRFTERGMRERIGPRMLIQRFAHNGRALAEPLPDRPAAKGVCSGRAHLTLVAGLLELFEIGLPKLLLVLAEFVEVLPRVYSGIVLIVEEETDGVVADRLDAIDIHLFFADLEHALARPMPLDLGRG
jgi:hypothetical protein